MSSHQLAAILFSDIVGYTSLMGTDERLAVGLLDINNRIHKKQINRYNGKWLKVMGDGILASFTTISDAVYCAGSIQREVAGIEGLTLRIGIHQGEVLVQKDDILGDGVNIASRIQSLAKPGQILVSENVFSNMKNRPGIRGHSEGEHILKNVDRSLTLYSLTVENQAQAELPKKTYTRTGVIIVAAIGIILLGYQFIVNPFSSDKLLSGDTFPVSISPEETDKSIAVLPFADLSPEGDQEYFSDGMMEEIRNHLNKIDGLRIPSRTSSMRYKGEINKSVQEIGKELGVAYILEGTIRKDRNDIRLAVQLIDVATDAHLWSETYDKELTDIFQIQSEIAKQIAQVLKTEISPGAKHKIENIPTDHPEAYDKYLQAHFIIHAFDIEQYAHAQALLEEVIELDPDFVSAQSLLGFSLVVTGLVLTNRETAINRIIPLLRRALELDPDEPQTHIYLAVYYLWYHWDFESAGKEWEIVNRQKSSNIAYYHGFTDFLLASGKFDEALDHVNHMLEIDRLNNISWRNKAYALCYNELFDQAIETIETTIKIFDLKTLPATLLESYLYAKRYEKVTAWKPEISNPRTDGAIAVALYHLGRNSEVTAIIQNLEIMANETAGGSPSFYLARIYAQMNAFETAFRWLEKAYQTHEVEMYWLNVDPLFEPLRGDPRWTVLVEKMGVFK